MTRQEFVRLCAGGAAGSYVLRAQQPMPETVIYKVAAGCEIKADVYGSGGSQKKPALMWIHGGALISGSRKSTAGPLHAKLLDAGYVIVSIDYRLAPETKLPQIIEDLQDAWKWMRKEGSAKFGIDPDRIATGGGSAGGYLTLMTGFSVEPRPRALVSYYGYGDIDGPWYAEPDPFYRKQPLVAKEEAWASVGKTAISEPQQGTNRGRFYLYCRQQGLWPNEVAGHDPHKEPKWFDRYCPIRNVTRQYPPTLLIHGTEDTDVPYAQSKMMSAKLESTGVKQELLTVNGAGHGLSGVAAEVRDKAAARAAEWVQMYTR